MLKKYQLKNNFYRVKKEVKVIGYSNKKNWMTKYNRTLLGIIMNNEKKLWQKTLNMQE